MRSGKKPTGSRSQQRQRLLHELAAEEAVFINYGGSYSRAVEAIEALERIRTGHYGACTECGGKIAAARLQIKPEAMRCISCQEQYEARASKRLAI